MSVEVATGAGALARRAATHVVAIARRAITNRGRFTVVLSGGETPRGLYRLLASPEFHDRIDWSLTEVFWADERCVPPDDVRSNYRMAEAEMLRLLPLTPGRVHRMPGEHDPRTAAEAYESLLRSVLAGTAGDERPFGFDLVLLGLGEDGHTASLFPGLSAVHESQRWVVAEYIDALREWRLTLTPPIVNASENVIFLVSGAAKADALARALEPDESPDDIPARAIRPRGQLTWLVDAEAAAQLSGDRNDRGDHADA